MSEDALRPVITSRPPRYRLAMWLAILPFVVFRPLIDFCLNLFPDNAIVLALIEATIPIGFATYSLYFAYLIIDILHRFDGFHAADPWIWLFACAQATLMGIFMFDTLWSTVGIIVIIEGVVRYAILGVRCLAGIGVWLSMRANSQSGLLGSCRLYRWLALGVGIHPIWSSIMSWINEPIEEAGFVVFGLILFLYIFLHPVLFYRASRALRAEAKRALENDCDGQTHE